MPRTLADDLGHPVELPEVVARVVSLVPSLTEALAATCPDRLVGATDWCTHPADLDARGRRAGARHEEPRPRRRGGAAARTSSSRTRRRTASSTCGGCATRGIPVWVTDIETVPGRGRRRCDGCSVTCWGSGPTRRGSSRRRRRGAGRCPRHPRAWSCRSGATRGWWSAGRRSPPTCSRGPGSRCRRRGSRGATRRSTSPRSTTRRWPTWCCCPDEPYVFTAGDGPEAFGRLPTRLVSGRLLTWYGPCAGGCADFAGPILSV